MARVACARLVSALLVSVAMAAGCASCAGPNCNNPLPPQPPRDPSCRTIDFKIHVGGFPDTGDLQPDYLVASNSTFTAVATAVEEMVCAGDEHQNRRPDFAWKLEFVPRGGAKVDVT